MGAITQSQGQGLDDVIRFSYMGLNHNSYHVGKLKSVQVNGSRASAGKCKIIEAIM